jgi:hypothetical protein
MTTGESLKKNAIEVSFIDGRAVHEQPVDTTGCFSDASLRKYYLDQVPGCYLSRGFHKPQHP